VLLYPGGCVVAKFLGVGFVEGGEEFKDGIGGSVAFGTAEAGELGFQVFGHARVVLPYFFNEIRGEVVDESEGFADNFGLCHG
jgi:hypothetical protein